MGRRALRKIDPALDLSPFLKTPDELPRPFCANTLFGRDAPLEVEVGSGKGLFMNSAATANGDHNFLGIEVSHKYARFAAARLAHNGLTNAVMVDGDAVPLLREWLPDASVAAVHVYFPDPWWKKRHEKRRVLQEPFLKDIQRVLVPGGSLHYWTDVKERFEETIPLIQNVTSLTGPLEVPEKPPEHDLDYRTHFERRMRKHGEPVYRSEFRKDA